MVAVAQFKILYYVVIRNHLYALKMCEGIDNGPIYKQKDISLEGSLSDILKRLNVTVNQLIKVLLSICQSQRPRRIG